jgi:hypothetical protein
VQTGGSGFEQRVAVRACAHECASTEVCTKSGPPLPVVGQRDQAWTFSGARSDRGAVDVAEASGGRFGSYTQAIYDVWDDFASRPSGRRGANNFACRRLLFGRVSAEGAFAAGWLPAGRVRRQGGVGLQRQHHGNLLPRLEVGAA